MSESKVSEEKVSQGPEEKISQVSQVFSNNPLGLHNVLDVINNSEETFKEKLYNVLIKNSNPDYVNLNNWFLEKIPSINIKDAIKSTIFAFTDKEGYHPPNIKSSLIQTVSEKKNEKMSPVNLLLIKINLQKYLFELGYRDTDINKIEVKNIDPPYEVVEYPFNTIFIRIDFINEHEKIFM